MSPTRRRQDSFFPNGRFGKRWGLRVLCRSQTFSPCETWQIKLPGLWPRSGQTHQLPRRHQSEQFVCRCQILWNLWNVEWTRFRKADKRDSVFFFNYTSFAAGWETIMPPINNWPRTTHFSCALPSTTPAAESNVLGPNIVLTQVDQSNARN